MKRYKVILELEMEFPEDINPLFLKGEKLAYLNVYKGDTVVDEEEMLEEECVVYVELYDCTNGVEISSTGSESTRVIDISAIS